MFDWIWHGFLDWFYITPFWYWVFYGFIATAFLVLVGWLFPAMRSFCGALIFAIIAGLSGYRRAQYDDLRHEQEIADRKKSQENGGDGWKW